MSWVLPGCCAPPSVPPTRAGAAEGQDCQAHPESLCLRLQVREPRHHCTIHDAWSGMRHVVQLRAQEEFGHGLWSEWSQAVLGTPWTGIVGAQRGLRLCYRIGYLLLGNESPQDLGKTATIHPLEISETGQPGSSSH